MMLPFTRYLREWFDFPSTETFCQVATVNNHSPSLRTMRLYDARDDALVFMTRTDTKKWNDLSLNPLVAVHMMSPSRGQIVINGVATGDTRETNCFLVTRYWQTISRDVRAIYTPLTNNDQEDPPVNFGVITVFPKSYDFLEIDRDHYLKSRRTLFVLDGSTWQKKSASLS